MVLLVFLPFGLYYLGVFPALAVLSGGVWGMLNLVFISAMVRAAVRPEGVDKRRVIGLALFKFPVLYVCGYCLLVVPEFQPLYLLLGFASLFAVMILRALGLVLVGWDDRPHKKTDVRGLA